MALKLEGKPSVALVGSPGCSRWSYFLRVRFARGTSERFLVCTLGRVPVIGPLDFGGVAIIATFSAVAAGLPVYQVTCPHCLWSDNL